MSSVNVPHETALKRHPSEVARIVAKVRSGKARDKDTDPATWQWRYVWGTRVEGYNIGQLLDGTAGKDAKRRLAMTADERVADQVARSRPAWLEAATVRTQARANLPDDCFPPECVAWIRVGVEAQVAEEARVASLTRAEKDADVAEALAFLTGPKNKGFMALKVPKRRGPST
jgi:hypothetical protein